MRGRLRTFLLQALKSYIADLKRGAMAVKRGGGKILISIDECQPEAYSESLQVPASDSPEESDAFFDREWAKATIDEAVIRFKASYKGDLRLLERLLEDPLASEARVSYSELGAELGRSPGAVKSAAHEVRKQFSSMLEEVVGETVLEPSDRQGELLHLFKAFLSAEP